MTEATSTTVFPLLARIVHVQVVSKIITFIINLGLARFSDPTAFGISIVSWGLLECLCLCILKDGYRQAALRQGASGVDDAEKENGINISSSLAVAKTGKNITFIITILLGVVWSIAAAVSGTSKDLSLLFSIAITCCGLMLQAAAEVNVTYTLLREGGQLFKTKVESICNIARTVAVPLSFVVFLFISSSTVSSGLYSFAVGNVVYGAVWFCSFPPAPEIPKSSISRHHREVIPSLCILAVQRSILNEAERLCLVFLFPATIWPIYALVTSLGAIVCRLLFAPVEEAAAVDFAGAGVTDALARIGQYLLVEGGVGLVGMSLGRPVMTSALLAIYGIRWSALGVPSALSMYTILLFLMGVNGPCERLMYACGDSAWLNRLQKLNVVVCVTGVAMSGIFRLIVSQYLFLENRPLRNDVLLIQALLLGSLLSCILRLAVFGQYLISINGVENPKSEKDGSSKDNNKLKCFVSTSVHQMFPPQAQKAAGATLAAGAVMRVVVFFTDVNGVVESANQLASSSDDAVKYLENIWREERLFQRVATEIGTAAVLGIGLLIVFYYIFSNKMRLQSKSGPASSKPHSM